MKHVFVTCLLACLTLPALAHEQTSDAETSGKGIRLNMALAISYAKSDTAWPTPRLSGLLGSGQTPEDRRQWALEHGTVSLDITPVSPVSLQLAWGWHDQDPAHVEAAWLHTNWQTHDASWQVGVGRKAIPMGPVLSQGGHLDRFAAMPLAKRVVLDDDWIDDGAALTWRNQADHEDGERVRVESLSVGVWQAQDFPGGEGAKVAPSLHVAMSLWSLRVDAFGISVHPTARGSYSQNERAAHTHDTPDCSRSLVGIFCFDGRSDVGGISVVWPSPLPHVRLQAGGLLRRDRGLLYSLNGQASYRGTTGGGWLDATWRFQPHWSIGTRLETVRGVQTIEGDGALLVATDAGLLSNQKHQRWSTNLLYQATPALQISAEAGQELHGDDQQTFALLRLVWTPTPFIDFRW